MQAFLQLGLSLVLLAAQCAPGTAVPSSLCERRCGNVDIPYPFGIEPNCSLSRRFQLSCKVQADGMFKPFNGAFEVLSISLTEGTTRVLNYIAGLCYNTANQSMEVFGRGFGYNGSPSSIYRLSDVQNKYTVIGCNAPLLHLRPQWYTLQRIWCGNMPQPFLNLVDLSHSGIGCSQTAIPKRMYNYITGISSSYNTSQIWKFNRCSYAVLMEAASFNFSTTYISTNKFNETYDGRVPVVLDWAVRDAESCDVAKLNKTGYACLSTNSKCADSTNDQGYRCNCKDGYEGNPYLPFGCIDANECNHKPCPSDGFCRNNVGGYQCSCRVGKKYVKESNTCNPDTSFIIGLTMGLFGLMVIVMITVFCGQMIFQKRKLNRVKQEYFRQHGGMLLFDRMKSEKGLSFNVFSEAELIHATDNFDSSRILGIGGHGTVYKGITKTNMPVAIKRCGVVDERQKKEFGQEMLILSQINHKNVVKLLGCCLEVEVPMLVYEFVANGTLFELIHGKNRALQISFSTLLRIAHEAAEGLSFLHSYASPPIIHGDVKTSNILLDDNNMAKVSDFGASILAPSDKEQFVTMVQGTCGYLDPEYMQTCQLTDKSDVYSFGVILLEILTGQLPLKLDESEKQKSLSLIFLSTMKANNLDVVLASHVKGQESMELLRGLADLAKNSLDMCGDNRPSMKEVADELNRLRKLSLHPWVQVDVAMGAESLLEGESTSSYDIELSGYPVSEIEDQSINPRTSYYAR
ncbi:unnamed protein product [Alopecurus aequalis]